MEIADRVNLLIESYLEENGLELVEVIYRREQGGMVLRLLVDTADGITVDECEKLNNFLSEALDEENVIDGHFVLEVASPGLDRAIVTDRDFIRVMDKELDISMYEPIDGKREHQGKLLGIDQDNIVIESAGVSTVIPRAKIAKAKLKIDF